MQIKRTIAILLVFIFCFAAFPAVCGTVASGEETDGVYGSERTHNIVYMVSDDSGSMSGIKTANACYAIQTFAGLLNVGDKLHFEMLNKTAAERDFIIGKTTEDGVYRNNDVVSILRDVTKDIIGGGTPIDAVQNSYRKIKNEYLEYERNGKGDAYKYWLVIVSDGAFSGYGDSATLLAEFRKYKNSFKNLNIVYMAIKGEDATGNVCYIYPSEDATDEEIPGIIEKKIIAYDDIVSGMNDIANMITGRYAIDDEHISISGDTVTFNTSGEICDRADSLGIILQKTNVEVKEIKCNGTVIFDSKTDNGAKLLYISPIYFEDHDKDSSKSGYTAIADGVKGGICGEICITLEKPAESTGLSIEKDNIKVLYEPSLALKIKASLYDTARCVWTPLESENFGEILKKGDKIKFSYEICEKSSGKVLATKQDGIPGSFFEIINESLTVNGTQKMFGEEIVLEEGKININARLKMYRDTYALTYSKEFISEAVTYRAEPVSSTTVSTEAFASSPQSVSFKVFRVKGGVETPITSDDSSRFTHSVAGPGTLSGSFAFSGNGIMKFTATSGKYENGTYKIYLEYGTEKLASAEINVVLESFGAIPPENITVGTLGFSENGAEMEFEIYRSINGIREKVTKKEFNDNFTCSVKSSGSAVISGNQSYDESTGILKYSFPASEMPKGTYTLNVLRGGVAISFADMILVEETYSANAVKPEYSFGLSEKNRTVEFSVNRVFKDSSLPPVPITASELSRISAELSGNGETSGVTLEFIKDGILGYKADGITAIGDYNVKLFYGGNEIAVTTMTFIDDRSVYGFKAVSSDSNEKINRNTLGNNKTGADFAVFKDGVRCSEAEIRAIMNSGDIKVGIKTNPLIKYTFITEVSSVNGESVLRVVPTTNNKNDKWRNLLLSGTFHLGEETLDVTLSSDTLRGTPSSDATLTSVGGTWWMTLIFYGFVLIICYLIFVIIAFTRVSRFPKGRIQWYNLTPNKLNKKKGYEIRGLKYILLFLVSGFGGSLAEFFKMEWKMKYKINGERFIAKEDIDLVAMEIKRTEYKDWYYVEIIDNYINSSSASLCVGEGAINEYNNRKNDAIKNKTKKSIRSILSEVDYIECTIPVIKYSDVKKEYGNVYLYVADE